MTKYTNDLNLLETDQHKIDSGTFNWKAYKDNEIYTGKNFATVDWKSDITWHYDKISNTVIVTNVDITLTNIPATAKANGFWDALIFFNPNKELPEGEGSYDYRQTPDLPGINGDSLYNQIGANNPSNGILAYYAHNNDTGAYTIKLSLNNTVPYSAEKVNSNTYRLVRTALRKNNHNVSVGKGPINDVVWKNGSIDILVSLPEKPDVPTKPTLKTTEVSYHHDVTSQKAAISFHLL